MDPTSGIPRAATRVVSSTSGIFPHDAPVGSTWCGKTETLHGMKIISKDGRCRIGQHQQCHAGHNHPQSVKKVTLPSASIFVAQKRFWKDTFLSKLNLPWSFNHHFFYKSAFCFGVEVAVTSRVQLPTQWSEFWDLRNLVEIISFSSCPWN